MGLTASAHRQSVILPSLLENGRGGVKADTPGLCQTISYLKVVQNRYIKIFEKMQKALLLALIKVFMNQVIPGYSSCICLGYRVDIKINNISFLLKKFVWLARRQQQAYQILSAAANIWLFISI